MFLYFIFVLYNTYLVQIYGQICNETQACSSYSGCLCFYKAYSPNASICVDGFLLSCDELVRCEAPPYECQNSEYECIYHHQCQKDPVCYPVPSYNEQFCPPPSMLNIPANATWKQNGMTVAGGNGIGGATNQFYRAFGLFVDDDETAIIADHWNHRIVQWKKGDLNGRVIAGGNSYGDRLDQLNGPTNVLIDKETDSAIITEHWNRRIVRWSRHKDTKQGELLIDNILSWGLAMDDQRYLYVSDYVKHEVRRYQSGEKNGTRVAGGNDTGNGLNQLNFPRYLFVDRQQNVYVSDNGNHRVMKWNKGAKEGIVIAGGNGNGSALTQLNRPEGIFVDALGTLYVADSDNHRVMRWSQGDKKGTVIVGGNGKGGAANQLDNPIGLSFDRHSNLYVADQWNHRVQRFDIHN